MPIPTVVSGSKGSGADTPSMRICLAACVETYAIAFAYFDSAGASISAPSWITTTTASSTMSIVPLVANQGVYTIKVTFTPTNKRSTTTLPQYTAATLTVGCIISSIAEMTTSGLVLTYKIFKEGTTELNLAAAAVSPNT